MLTTHKGNKSNLPPEHHSMSKFTYNVASDGKRNHI